MASNKIEIHSSSNKKQKRVVSNNEDPVGVVVLSIGNVVQHFPDLLVYLLPYIADRQVFNSIAASSRDTYEQSKAIRPPWPNHYKLQGGHENYDSLAVWSPDGTRIACKIHFANIVIVDQRYGIIHRIINDQDFYDLKFAPSGNFLASADQAGFIKLWDNSNDGNYEQLQEWNIGEEIGVRGRTSFSKNSISISACSKFIVVVLHNRRVFLKDVERGGETIRSLLIPPNIGSVENVMFSVDGNAVFICFQPLHTDGTFFRINVWRPYLDDVENNYITLTRQIIWPDPQIYANTFVLSHDATMIAILDKSKRKGMTVWSIDNEYKRLKLEAKFQAKIETIQFTSDDKHIVCGTNDRLLFWSTVDKQITSTQYYSSDKSNMKHLKVMDVSLISQRVVVHSNHNGRLSYHIIGISK